MEATKEKILEFLKEKREARDILKEFKATKSEKKEISQLLKTLEDDGKIEKIKEENKVYYRLSGLKSKRSAGERKNKKELLPKENRNKYIVIGILILIILTGFHLRTYHLDYPVIGYHNWKEVSTLSEARNYYNDGFFKYGPFISAFCFPYPGDDPSGAHSDTFPSISIIGGLFMKIFGPELVVARMAGILIGLASVFMMYLLMRELFKREDISLTAAFIMAIIPLFVFYDGKFHSDIPAVLFMLTSAYFYVKWVNSDKRNDFILVAFFLTFATVTRYPCLIMAIPMALTFPYDRLINMEKLRKHIKEYLISFLIFLFFPIWHLYNTQYVSKVYGDELGQQFGLDPGLILNSGWWDTILFRSNSFIADNYTHIAFYIAVLGLIFIFWSYIKNRDFASKFVLGYGIAVIPFVVIMAPKLMGHNYHQFPIAPLIAILIAYFAYALGDFIGKMKVNVGKKNGEEVSKPIESSKYLPAVFMVVISLFLYVSMQESTDRMFNTQFHGLDVAGEYIKAHSEPDEFIIHSGHQDFGITWHADRKLHGVGFPSNVSEIKEAEEDRNARWIFIYNWGMGVMQDERGKYIKENYKLRQFAFYMTNEGISPVYFLFEKGGTYDENELNRMLQSKGNYLYKDYEYTTGIARMYYIEIND